MKIHKAITFSLLISVFFILCINVNYFNDDQQNSIKDNLDTQLQNADIYQKKLENYKEINSESAKSSTPLDSKEAYAIVVGISDYPGSTSDLSYCDDDSQDIYSMLINDFNFKTENVYYLQDSVASKAAISDAFDQIASKIDDNDIFFFYYSGHGGAGTSSTGSQSYSIDSPHPYSNNMDRYWNIYRSGAAYMRVHFDHFDVEYDYDYVFLGDTDLLPPNFLYYEGYTGYSSGFWSGWIPLLSDNKLYINLYTDYSITEWGFSIDSYEAELYDGTHFLCSYDSIPSTPSNYYMDDLLDSKLDLLNCDEKYIVLDACNTGGMIPEIQEIGRSIMTACQADEFSLESSSLQHGVFTNFFLESFNSATDSNSDGVISMEESFSYTSSNTISYSGGLGYTHHPQQYDGISGESVLTTAFGSLSLIQTGNSLSYSFHMYGTGLIEHLRIAACNISQTITYAVEDLTANPASSTGFGYYSGTLQLNGDAEITDYGIFARVNGSEVLFLNQTVSSDTDSDTIDDIIEIMFGMNISDTDSDSDGIDDIIEFYGATDPSSNDTDNDGLMDGDEIYIYFTDPTNPDVDNDLLSDGDEVLIHFTNPFDPDTDGDGMDDYYEVIFNLNPLINDANLDPDFDNIPNIYEFGNNTDPHNADTDGDTIEDGDEILTYLTDPTTNDTDGEGLTDDFELFIYHTNATNNDTEGDGMDDFYEYTYSLDPFTDDSGLDLDGDGLINLLESQCGTNPHLPDTDGDSMTDLYEYDCSLNPLADDANLDYDNDGLNNLLEFLLNSLADDTDSDDDLMPDLWEYNNDLDLIMNDASLDADNDGLNNLLEFQCGTNPNLPDSDGDFMTDLYEYDCSLNPLADDANLDYDNDGLSNLLEFLLNSLADDTDSDDDLMPDLWEYEFRCR
ncbi:MAG: caspase family protein [Promethearchaeota archaeon]